MLGFFVSSRGRKLKQCNPAIEDLTLEDVINIPLMRWEVMDTLNHTVVSKKQLKVLIMTIRRNTRFTCLPIITWNRICFVFPLEFYSNGWFTEYFPFQRNTHNNAPNFLILILQFTSENCRFTVSKCVYFSWKRKRVQIFSLLHFCRLQPLFNRFLTQ